MRVAGRGGGREGRGERVEIYASKYMWGEKGIFEFTYLSISLQ